MVTVAELIKYLQMYPETATVTVGVTGASRVVTIEGIATAFRGQEAYVTLCILPEDLHELARAVR